MSTIKVEELTHVIGVMIEKIRALQKIIEGLEKKIESLESHAGFE